MTEVDYIDRDTDGSLGEGDDVISMETVNYLPQSDVVCCRMAIDHLDPLAQACETEETIHHPFYTYVQETNTCTIEGFLQTAYLDSMGDEMFSEYGVYLESTTSDACCSAKRAGLRGMNLENSCTTFEEPSM